MADDTLSRFDITTVANELEYVDFNDLRFERKPVIFDTNFLFCTFQYRLDLIGSLQSLVGHSASYFIYEGTISELENLGKKKTPNKKFLPLIAKFLKVYNFRIIKSSKSYIDEQILDNLDDHVLIATNDKELKFKIKENGGQGILLRQRAYLEFF